MEGKDPNKIEVDEERRERLAKIIFSRDDDLEKEVKVKVDEELDEADLREKVFGTQEKDQTNKSSPTSSGSEKSWFPSIIWIPVSIFFLVGIGWVFLYFFKSVDYTNLKPEFERKTIIYKGVAGVNVYGCGKDSVLKNESTASVVKVRIVKMDNPVHCEETVAWVEFSRKKQQVLIDVDTKMAFYVYVHGSLVGWFRPCCPKCFKYLK